MILFVCEITTMICQHRWQRAQQELLLDSRGSGGKSCPELIIIPLPLCKEEEALEPIIDDNVKIVNHTDPKIIHLPHCKKADALEPILDGKSETVNHLGPIIITMPLCKKEEALGQLLKAMLKLPIIWCPSCLFATV